MTSATTTEGFSVDGPVGDVSDDGNPGSGPVVATMHRVENLHRADRFDGFLDLLGRAGPDVTFAVHPPTDGVLARRGGRVAVEANGVVTTDLVPYDEFVTMLAAAPFVITDGGSIQEECARLGVPTLLSAAVASTCPDG